MFSFRYFSNSLFISWSLSLILFWNSPSNCSFVVYSSLYIACTPSSFLWYFCSSYVCAFFSSLSSLYNCTLLLSKNFFSIKAAYSFISKTFIVFRRDCFYLSSPTFDRPFSSISFLSRSPSFWRFSFWALRVDISASLRVMMFLSSEKSVRSLSFSFF